MHITGKVGTVIAGAALVTGASASAFAAPDPGTTYTGTFSGQITYTSCDPDPGTHNATGDWSVTVKPNGHAVGTFTIQVDGNDHVAYTTHLRPAAEPLAGAAFTETVKTKAGPLTVSLSSSTGAFTYRISPYNFYTPESLFPGATTVTPMQCEAVTYNGTADTSG